MTTIPYSPSDICWCQPGEEATARNRECPLHGDPATLGDFYDLVTYLLQDVECYCAEGVADRTPCAFCRLRALKMRVSAERIGALDQLTPLHWWLIHRLANAKLDALRTSEFLLFVNDVQLLDVSRIASTVARELTNPEDRDA